MKKIALLFTFLLVITSCKCQKVSTNESGLNTDSEVNLKNQSINEEQLPVIEYGATSRGFLFALKVENKVLEYTQKSGHIPDRDLKGFENKIMLSDKDWNEIITYLKEVKLDEVKDYKWPTEMRYYDGAPHANITFVKNGEKFSANGFDHGHPPVEVEKLVNKIMSLIPKK